MSTIVFGSFIGAIFSARAAGFPGRQPLPHRLRGGQYPGDASHAGDRSHEGEVDEAEKMVDLCAVHGRFHRKNIGFQQ